MAYGSVFMVTHTHIYIIFFKSFYYCDPDKGSLRPKYSDCTTPNGLELYIYECVCVRVHT